MRKILGSALLLLLSGWLWAAPVKTFQGGTDRTTSEKFQVSGPWKLTWDFQGTALKVHLFSDKAGPSARPITQAGSGQGSMSVEQGGTFWLEIESVGSYTIQVDSVTTSAGKLPVFEGGMERKGSSVFSAPSGWGYRYSIRDGVLKVILFDAQRNQVGEPSVLLGSGSSDRAVGKAGRYFFMIQSTGNYRIEVFRR